MAAIIEMSRVFRYAGLDLEDPNPELAPREVLRHYARMHPRLNGAKIVDPVVEGDKQVYEFREANYGDKG
ncbi:MAG: PRTRC system protein C [Pseudomonadales bacterium]|nr:PRTRC system protein C [Pseudomonadales bacterium]|tara:strand:- start:5682 stop:5891 length:210 start_codon:yes stop_codon:yes gene_type:complete